VIILYPMVSAEVIQCQSAYGWAGLENPRWCHSPVWGLGGDEWKVGSAGTIH
jgi:hypothetical protein